MKKVFCIVVLLALTENTKANSCMGAYVKAGREYAEASERTKEEMAEKAPFLLWPMGQLMSFPMSVESTELSESSSLSEGSLKIAQLISEAQSGDGIELRNIHEAILSKDTSINIEFDAVVKTVWSLDNSGALCPGKLLTYEQAFELVSKSALGSKK